MVRVSDGDTVVVREPTGIESTIRLLGTNAPEPEECLAAEATDHLRRRLAGTDVRVEGRGTDQFGRLLAYVWDGGELVNLEMIARGLAIATTPPDGDPYGPILADAEQAAFDNGTGMWGPTACGTGSNVPDVDVEVAEPNPPGGDETVLSGEMVMVINRGSDPVDLEGWVLRDESSLHRYRFPSTTLGRGERVLITSADGGWDPGGGPVWNNGGDMALLLDGEGRVVARHRYGR